jgi:hypothetical protein
MLSQVVESGESPGAVTLERAFSGVFSDVAGQMFAPSEAEIARWIIGAVKPLRLFLFGLCPVGILAVVVGSGAVVTAVPFSVRVIHVHVVRVP